MINLMTTHERKQTVLPFQIKKQLSDKCLKDGSVLQNHSVEYVCGRIKKFLKFGHTEIIMLPVEVIGVVCFWRGVDCMFSVEEVRIG